MVLGYIMKALVDTIVRYHPRNGRYFEIPPISASTWMAHFALLGLGLIAVLRLLLQPPSTTLFALGVVFVPGVVGGAIDLLQHTFIGTDTDKEVGLFKTANVLFTVAGISFVLVPPFGLAGALGLLVFLPWCWMGVLSFANKAGRVAGTLSVISIWSCAALSTTLKIGVTYIALSSVVTQILNRKSVVYTDKMHGMTAWLLTIGFLLMILGV